MQLQRGSPPAALLALLSMALKFALSAVLALRQQKEEAEECALASIGRELQQVRAARARVEAEMAQTTQGRQGEVQQLLPGAHHHAAYARFRMLQEAATALDQQQAALETKRDGQQALYLKAKADREMISDLKEKQKNAYEREVERREQKRMDDLFAARHARR